MKLSVTPIAAVVLLSVFGTFALSPAVYAGKDRGPEAQAEKKLEFFKSTVGITDDQVDAVKAILLDEATKLAELPPSMDADERKEKLKEVKKEAKEALNSVLTPEQKAKMKELSGKGGKG